MHVTACLAGQKEEVEVGEDCRSLQALREAIVVALPQLQYKSLVDIVFVYLLCTTHIPFLQVVGYCFQGNTSCQARESCHHNMSRAVWAVSL